MGTLLGRKYIPYTHMDPLGDSTYIGYLEPRGYSQTVALRCGTPLLPQVPSFHTRGYGFGFLFWRAACHLGTFFAGPNEVNKGRVW